MTSSMFGAREIVRDHSKRCKRRAEYRAGLIGRIALLRIPPCCSNAVFKSLGRCSSCQISLRPSRVPEQSDDAPQR